LLRVALHWKEIGFKLLVHVDSTAAKDKLSFPNGRIDHFSEAGFEESRLGWRRSELE